MWFSFDTALSQVSLWSRAIMLALLAILNSLSFSFSVARRGQRPRATEQEAALLCRAIAIVAHVSLALSSYFFNFF